MEEAQANSRFLQQRLGGSNLPLTANLSKDELRQLLTVLMRTPSEVIKQTGHLLMLLEAIARTNLSADGGGGGQGTSGSAIVAWKMSRPTSSRVVRDIQQQDLAVIESARKQVWASSGTGRSAVKGSGVVDEAGRLKALRSWAARSHRNVKSTLQVLRSGLSAIGQTDARLLWCCAKRISVEKAARVSDNKSEPGLSLFWVTRALSEPISRRGFLFPVQVQTCLHSDIFGISCSVRKPPRRDQPVCTRDSPPIFNSLIGALACVLNPFFQPYGCV